MAAESDADQTRDTCSSSVWRVTDPLVLSIWLGLLTGLGEVGILAMRKFSQHRMVFQPAEVLWMAPLMDVILFAVCGAVLSLVALRRPRWASLRITCLVLVTLSAFSLLGHFASLAIWARLLLALGIGTQGSRLLAWRPKILSRCIRASTGWVVLWRGSGPSKDEATTHQPLVHRRQVILSTSVGLAGLATGMHLWRRDGQRRAVAALRSGPATPNVLLLVLDTVRAQSMSLHGYERDTSPRLAAFAERGLCFNRAFSPSSWTLPSHATFFTGRYLHETHSDISAPLGPKYPVLAETLSGHGYETAAFSANLWFITREYGMDRGFTVFREHCLTSPGQVINSSVLGRQLLEYRMSRRLLLGQDNYAGRKSAAMINRELLSWMSRRDRSRPFFAFVNYYDAHSPYVPTARFANHFSDLVPDNPWSETLAGEDVTVDTPRVVAGRDAYDRCIAGLDDAIGNLISKLDRAGDLDQTILIITSDHGEHFGEHRLTDHVNSLYMPLLHVPLVVSLPGQQGPKDRVNTPVSLRDLPATVMDLVGLEHEFPGTSWRAGWESGATGQDPLLFEVNPTGNDHPKWSPLAKGPMRSLVEGDYQYIRNGDDSEEFYNYVSDPGEEQNLAQSGEHTERIARLRDFLNTI